MYMTVAANFRGPGRRSVPSPRHSASRRRWSMWSIDGNHLDNITSRLASGENIDEWLQAYRAAYGRPLALM